MALNRSSLRSNLLKFKTSTKLTDQFKKNTQNILQISMEKNWKISTCNKMDLETQGFSPIMPIVSLATELLKRDEGSHVQERLFL